MKKIYYIADLHLGHLNALSFDNRPFSTTEAQDNYIIERWNRKIKEDDDVYILGDISWYKVAKTLEILSSLNGNKILVQGNHDKKLLKSQEIRDCFQKVVAYEEIKDNEKDVILCHYPIPCFNKHYKGAVHFYGHVHSSFEWNMMENIKRQMIELYERPCKMFNVGAMMNYIIYEPRTLDEIVNGGY